MGLTKNRLFVFIATLLRRFFYNFYRDYGNWMEMFEGSEANPRDVVVRVRRKGNMCVIPCYPIIVLYTYRPFCRSKTHKIQ